MTFVQSSILGHWLSKNCNIYRERERERERKRERKREKERERERETRSLSGAVEKKLTVNDTETRSGVHSAVPLKTTKENNQRN